MSTKWSTDETTTKSGMGAFAELFKDEYAVILLQGKNTFGDFIYSYVQVALPDIKRLHAALANGEDFTPSDFGTIVAAGKGEPPEAVRNEIAATYKTLEPIIPATFQPASAQPIPTEKKAWDEY